MDAHVYLDGAGNHMVSLRIAGLEVDVAGPFDDETDALLMAERSVYDGGRVIVASPMLEAA